MLYLSDLFASLEQSSETGTKAADMGVLEYGLSMTNLEEVFLKLENNEKDEGNVPDQQQVNENVMGSDDMNLVNNMHVDNTMQTSQLSEGSNLSHLGEYTTDKTQLRRNRIYAPIQLRMRMIYRFKIRIFLQVILPIIFTCVGAYVLTTQSKYTPSDPIELDITDLKVYYLENGRSGSNSRLDYVGGEEQRSYSNRLVLNLWFYSTKCN